MEEVDSYFVHLAQQNFEQCEGMKGSLGSALRCYEEFYLAFDWVELENTSRLAILEALEDRIRQTSSHIALLTQLLPILSVRTHLCATYRALTNDRTAAQSIGGTLDQLARDLRAVTAPSLAPYRDTCLCEVLILEQELASSIAISQGNYYMAIVAMTQFRQRLRQWEFLFIHKKYTPSGPNSKVDYNGIYKWHVQYFHNLLAKVSVYFAGELKEMADFDLVKYGMELRNRYLLHSIESDFPAFQAFYLIRIQEKVTKLIYQHPATASALPIAVTTALLSIAREKITQRKIEENIWLLTQVENEVYACVKTSNERITAEYQPSFLSLIMHLSSPVP